MSRLQSWIKWVSVVLILLSLFAIFIALPVKDAFLALEDWIAGLGVTGLVIFIAIYAVATVLMVPGSPLTLAAGAIFGPLWGGWGLLWVTVAVSIASNLGAAMALLIGRYFARDRVAAWARKSPKFDAVDRAVAEGGWKIVAMLRLSPAVPFNLQNYLYGLTPIPFWTCVLTSIVAMLPGTFLYVYVGYLGRVGAEAAAGAESVSTAQLVLFIVGLVAAVAVTVYVTALARRALKRQTDIEEAGPEPVEEETSVTEGQEPEPRGWPWGTVVAALLAVVMVTMASCAHLTPRTFQNTLRSAVGLPPQVELQEAYADGKDGATVDHSTFGRLLKQHVDDAGWIDYPGLREEEAALDEYLDVVANAPFDELGRDEKLALLINAYNAFTLKLILDHWPVESIRDIPADQRWDGRMWNVGGNEWTLNEIEHQQIRPKFREPRIHFVLVCAAAGCPPLATEPFVADKLDQQLEEQTQYVHNHNMWLELEREAGVIHLTNLYNWYGGDFEQVAGSVLDYAARYAPELKAMLEQNRRPSIEWIPYDWTLNSQANRYPRDERRVD